MVHGRRIRDCSRPGCDRPADYMLEGSKDGEGVVMRQAVCEWHARDIATPCSVEGCDLIGVNKAPGHGRRADGTFEPIEIRFCREHFELVWRSAMVTLKGVARVMHDGQGHLKMLPPQIGRG